MKILIGSAVLVAALTACGGSHRVVTNQAPAQQLRTLPTPLVRLIHSISKDKGVSGRKVVVYGPGSRYLLVKASSGDLVPKTASERKGFYLVVVRGHFVGFSHPAGTKAPRGTIETQVWSATEGVTDTGISDRLAAAVFRLHKVGVVALASHTSGPPAARSSSTMVSSTRLILGGRARCTATVSRSVQAGSPLGLTFAVRNVSKRTVRVPLTGGGMWLVVRAADGTTYDTRVPLRSEIGPLVAAPPIAPGATKRVAWVGKYLRVRWRGPLRVTPGCGTTALQALAVAVQAPGPPTDERTAVADVVAASGHLLDHCRPERAGVAVQGLIYPPSGTTPPMAATCSVSLRREGQFLVAQALIASPRGIEHAHVNQPYEQLSVHHASPYEVVAWQFVVTKSGATPVAATEVDATQAANRMAPDWSWTSSGVQRLGSGSSRCGGSGESWGGTGPTVEFISACPS